MVCPLDTAAALSQNYGGLSCFLVLLPRSLVLVRCFREANVAIFFCGRFSWSRQTCLSNGFSRNIGDSITGLYSRSINVEVIPKQKRLNTV